MGLIFRPKNQNFPFPTCPRHTTSPIFGPPCSNFLDPLPHSLKIAPAVLMASYAWDTDGESDEEDEEEYKKTMKRQRLLLAATLTVMADLPEGNLGPRGPKRRSRMFFVWSEHCAQFNEREFKERYRLTLESFNKLLELLRPLLQTVNSEMAERSKPWCEEPAVAPEARLAICLRYLAGGQMTDLRIIYFVSKAQGYESVWRCVDAINSKLSPLDPLGPGGCYVDEDKMATIERDFRAASRSAWFKGCIGALDGCDFAQFSPGVAVPNPMRYFVERKGKYCILCIAICDHLRRYLWWDMSVVPQTHDSLAFKTTALGQAIANGEISHPCFAPFLNADPAFSAGPNMVVPIKDNDFDFFQSSSRMPIECSFGILVRRWGILWRPLTMRFDKRAPVISACMNLHNFCINERVSADIPPEGPNGTRQVQPDDGRGVRFVRYPTFDDKGRPVWYLDRDHEPAAAAAAGDVGPTPTAANPTELLKGRLAEKNLKAPSGPRGSRN